MEVFQRLFPGFTSTPYLAYLWFVLFVIDFIEGGILGIKNILLKQ